jgi:hypothetical protein
MRQNSTLSNWKIDYRITLAFASLIGVLFFLLVSARTYRIGFPLDDTWIHLVYARNLALHGEWSFRLGETSGGSTSPMWTALLSIGYWIRLAPYAWTYFLGWLILALIAARAENIARRVLAPYPFEIPWVGLFVALAWHLTWSAASGMETLLHGMLILIVLGMLMERSRQYLTLGLLAGLSVWVRPDGLTLLGPILFTAYFQESTLKERLRALWKVFMGFGILFGFYLLFNLALSGTPMPNTFYAKQAEYGEYWLSKTLSERLSDYLLPVLASPFIVLIPGAVLWFYNSIRERNWGAIAGLLWFTGYVGIYFMRLPAYQHGRYIIPAFPTMYLWGMLGLMGYALRPNANRRLLVPWGITAALLCLSFQVVGAVQNASDVIWIETQMVQTAKWVNEHLTPDDRLAVHDIGAIGYFAPNPLIDLAGLITPEVVPFIRDEERLASFMDSAEAEYLIVFPGLYPRLTRGMEPVYTAGAEVLVFEENMQVYRWR